MSDDAFKIDPLHDAMMDVSHLHAAIDCCVSAIDGFIDKDSAEIALPTLVRLQKAAIERARNLTEERQAG